MQLDAEYISSVCSGRTAQDSSYCRTLITPAFIPAKVNHIVYYRATVYLQIELNINWGTSDSSHARNAPGAETSINERDKIRETLSCSLQMKRGRHSGSRSHPKSRIFQTRISEFGFDRDRRDLNPKCRTLQMNVP